MTSTAPDKYFVLTVVHIDLCVSSEPVTMPPFPSGATIKPNTTNLKSNPKNEASTTTPRKNTRHSRIQFLTSNRLKKDKLRPNTTLLLSSLFRKFILKLREMDVCGVREEQDVLVSSSQAHILLMFLFHYCCEINFQIGLSLRTQKHAWNFVSSKPAGQIRDEDTACQLHAFAIK